MAQVIKFDNDTYLYGTIIEKGSNSNGKYIKYSDGTLIQYGIISLGIINYANGDGVVYLAPSVYTKEFPISFKDTNISISLAIENIGGGVGGICGSGTTKSLYSFYTYHFVSAQLNTNISFVAIGKWK